MPHHDPVRPDWRTSSHSTQSGECVEVANLGHAIGVRDSKNPNGPALRFTRPEIRALLDKVHAGHLDGG